MLFYPLLITMAASEGTDPQSILDIIESAISKMCYRVERYLVERNKATATPRSDGLLIKVENIAATPVRALRWDYLIGNSLIHNREFILADTNYAEYFLRLCKTSETSLTMDLFGLKALRLSPQLLTESELGKDRLERKLSLEVNCANGYIRSEEAAHARDRAGDSELIQAIMAAIPERRLLDPN